jgi:hypothetical protein
VTPDWLGSPPHASTDLAATLAGAIVGALVGMLAGARR